eukprot:TRINITY_DN773360_c0_g1_i1.p1 TRINITY_DN773360_c0_g1~~TRINITY_DN773360_c0_g1_i1.p1  ORF type:complete len:135 (+),score=47.15 TRINITY_DN773360_c0_g1_i1:94-498(+)
MGRSLRSKTYKRNNAILREVRGKKIEAERFRDILEKQETNLKTLTEGKASQLQSLLSGERVVVDAPSVHIPVNAKFLAAQPPKPEEVKRTNFMAVAIDAKKEVETLKLNESGAGRSRMNRMRMMKRRNNDSTMM